MNHVLTQFLLEMRRKCIYTHCTGNARWSAVLESQDRFGSSVWVRTRVVVLDRRPDRQLTRAPIGKQLHRNTPLNFG